MDAREFAEWYAYAMLEPFGQTREDQRAGTIASAIVNVHTRKGAKIVTWRDFFPLPGAREELDWQSLLAKVESVNSALGGTDERKSKPA